MWNLCFDVVLGSNLNEDGSEGDDGNDADEDDDGDIIPDN